MIVTRILALSLLVLASSAARANESDLSGMRWLAGCWNNTSAEPGSGEQWTPLAGGTFLGISRTVKQGKTAEYEFMQIRDGADGKPVFLAQPSGQSPAAFPLLRLSGTEAVFENLQHDFPQRVIYALEGKKKLNVRIEGMRNNRLLVIAFPMSRVSCDS